MLPTNCACGKAFDIHHALSCPTGGYPSLRHNELRDITAHLMREVCHDVTTEPSLQPITGESLTVRSYNLQDNARLDVAASEFWGLGAQRAFFDVRVFNPSAPSHQSTSIHALFRRQEKRCQYEQRVREIERGFLHPSYSPPLEEWDRRQVWSIKGWRRGLQQNGRLRIHER